MKSRLFVVTGNGDKDINITSNGGVILFLTPHENWNMHFLMMAKYWLTTKNATTFNFSFVSIWTHVSPSTVQCGWRIIVLRDHLQSHQLLGQYKTCAGNKKRPGSHYPPTFRPLQNHWKVLNCWHVFIPLWQLYCLCLPDNSLSWRTLSSDSRPGNGSHS